MRSFIHPHPDLPPSRGKEFGYVKNVIISNSTNRFLKLIFISIFTMAIMQSLCYAQLDYKGFIDTYHAVRIKEPQDYLSSKTRLRMETFAGSDNASLFASFNLTKNHIIPSQDGLQLREAYLQYAAGNWDMRVGRQIIIWGKADGVEITDVISPKDYTEFLAQDYDDIRIPVDALKLRYLQEKMTLELVCVPVSQPAVLPGDDSPWAIDGEMPEGVEVSYKDPIIPELKLKNSEIGGRILFYLPGFDFTISGLYTWDKMPVMRQTITEGEKTYMTIQPEYHRLTFVGCGFSFPYSSFVFRGESAFFNGKHFESESPSEGLFEKNTINSLMGMDWYPGGELTITAQFAYFFILDYEKGIAGEEHDMLATYSISRNLFRNTLSLSISGYIGINNSELFNRASMDYALTDNLHLESGVDIFAGDEGLFGQYKKNNQIWLKAKYSF